MRPFKNLLIIFFLLSFRALAQTTPNIGFETGDFSNWQCYSGTIDATGNINVSLTSPISGLFTIIGKESSTILDQYGQFPIFCPNGSNYSIKLNDNTTHAKAQRVTYTFTAPSKGPYSVIFNYAVVLENPSHMDYQQPKFTAFVYDVTDGMYIDCPSFNFNSSTATNFGFNQSTVNGAQGASIFYKDWSTATIDLAGYLGKTIRLEFTVNDCTLGGHFGYAYLDVEDSDSSSPITGNSYCTGQKSVTLLGPTGFAGYTWYDATLKKQLGTNQTLRLSPAPPDMTKYALVVSPFPLLGCVDTLYTTVNKINSGFNLAVQDTVLGCIGSTVDLTAASVTAGSSADMKYSYYVDSLGTTYLPNPNLVSAAGTYYIKGINAEGCQNILPVYVYFANPTIKIIEPAAVDFPTTIDLSKTVVGQAGLTYSYYADAAGTIPLTNYTAIKYSGSYYVKAVNSIGCVNIVPVDIVIHPPPPYTITAPNTFTPNNDGINDHFSISITGVITFYTLKIFNRGGQLVFTAKSPTEYWDGNFNGKNVPADVYYWVLYAEDDYNNVKINKASSITLLR